MKTWFLFTAILVSLLAACSSDNKSPTTNNGQSSSSSAAAENIALIDNEDLTPGLKGIDADGNGIRDDIDRFIAKKYSATPAMKKVAEQKARAFQKSMEATTREQARVAGNEIVRAANCAFKVLPRVTPDDIKFREQMSIEIKALTANTKERFMAYWHGEKLAGGMVFRQAEEPVCD
jgi:hypothetical protein